MQNVSTESKESVKLGQKEVFQLLKNKHLIWQILHPISAFVNVMACTCAIRTSIFQQILTTHFSFWQQTMQLDETNVMIEGWLLIKVVEMECRCETLHCRENRKSIIWAPAPPPPPPAPPPPALPAPPAPLPPPAPPPACLHNTQ